MRPQKTTFEEQEPAAGSPQAFARGENSPEPAKPEPLSSVDACEIIDGLLSGGMSLDELSGTQAMAVLLSFVQDLMALTERSADATDAGTIFDGAYEVLLQNASRDAAQDGAGDGDARPGAGARFSGAPAVYRPLLERVYEQKARSLAEQRRASLVSASQEEIGVPLRMGSKMLSNFEDELAQSGSSLLDTRELYDEPLLPLTCKDLKSYIHAHVGSCEPITRDPDDRASYGKKFNLKTAPNVSLEFYIDRINAYSHVSGSVALCAGILLMRFLFNVRSVGLEGHGVAGDNRLWPMALAGSEPMLPVTELNVFRLLLTSLRLASKLLEDKNYAQKYYCKVCGLQQGSDLFRMELALGFGIDWCVLVNEFDIWPFLLLLKSIKGYLG